MASKTLKDRAGTDVPREAIDRLAGDIRGEVIGPSDAAYEDARHIWNALIDKRPGLIVRCSGTADVVAAVNFARENDVLVAVRGGGHNVGGRALCDDGLVIDLSRMRGVHVDPGSRTVRVQGGATLGDVDRETHLFGLAVPFGVISKTGVGGLTLGGGVGWLVRKYGPTCDNVLEMEVVQADGTVRTANPKENADLHWALCGGGGNFGIVTSFLYQAHPVSTVVGGLIVYPRAAAGKVLRGYREFMASAPEDLTVYAGLICTPDGTPGTAIIPCWSGADLDEGKKRIEPLTQLDEPMMVAVEPMPFPAMQSILDGAFPSGTRNYWKSAFVEGLPDEVIDIVEEQAKGMTSPMSGLLVEYYGGAGGRKAADENAFAQRRSDYCIGFMPQWTDPSEDESHIAWARSAWEAIQPFASEGYLLNYLSAGEEDAIRAAFGSNYDRLTALKARYDPGNFFSQNQNIRPAA
ncbi:FAD-binding oxidoreductase [Silicimonas algicola]|uniref:FAD/FMN-containing dehydrogenase n=1 Tax=Silicimonas algicola TaxID=1826607 RepID=A0A316G332_9RHOB|nr:FAD-binding oxidoreductase [Silicimonas algicola]AZQ67115.1 FAD-binding oxidoreductase [Silicimonas algicola]PWK55354.1 FAD/FMN-containing dehydrogenase [Silicimonas algicola]